MQTDHRKAGLGADMGKRMTLSVGEGHDGFCVTFSAGIERFIGRYPRIEAISPNGALLVFSAAEGGPAL